MLNVTIDERTGFTASSGAGSCAVCCCEPIFMRPGETNLMVMNYAPWSVPLGGQGVVPATELEIFRDSSTCSSAAIDGFALPSNSAYAYAAAVSPVITPIPVNTNEAPALNVFDYTVVPLFGPKNGVLVAAPLTGLWTYQPNNGFVGYDEIYYQMRDAQGRTFISAVRITVGAPVISAAQPFGALGLFIDRTKIKVDQRFQTISFPMFLAPDARQCDVFKVQIKQPARNCDDLFYHLTCFEVHVGKC